MMISRRLPKLQKGFTLLEVLASIFLLAIMTLGIVSTMRQNSKLTKKLQSRTSSTLSGEIALDRMQRELQAAIDEHNIQGSKTFFKADEVGAGSHFSFSFIDSETRTLYERRGGGIVVAEYELEKETGKSTYRLNRKQVPLVLLDKLTEAESQILAEGVISFKAEFYDYRNDRWNKTWDTQRKDTTPNFPKAVRLEIETVDTDLPEREWKDKSLKLSTSFPVLNEWELK